MSRQTRYRENQKEDGMVELRKWVTPEEKGMLNIYLMQMRLPQKAAAPQPTPAPVPTLQPPALHPVPAIQPEPAPHPTPVYRMVVAIDVGSSNRVYTLYKDGEIFRLFRVSLGPDETRDVQNMHSTLAGYGLAYDMDTGALSPK